MMRAVATAVLQADALEHVLLAALPLGPQGAAGGVSLPDLFRGELQVCAVVVGWGGGCGGGGGVGWDGMGCGGVGWVMALVGGGQ